MLLMIACAALLLIGLAAVVAWGGESFRPPQPRPTDERLPNREVLRRYLWYVNLMVAAGVGAGFAIAGAGGRLAMRLVAATAGAEAQGRVTEADQVVGVISVEGTLGFITFTGLVLGVASGLLYLLIRRWLPRGRWAGTMYGVLLLVLFSTRVEPLRPDNPDFDIVGPGWVSLLAFGSLAVAHGMAVAALAARLSRALPLVEAKAKILAWYLPLVVLVPAAPLLVPIVIGGFVALGLNQLDRMHSLLTSRRLLVIGRALGVIVLGVALPGFLTAAVDILGRGPG